MSEKEQIQAIKLLTEWLQSVRATEGVQPPADLVERTEKFLKLEAAPESHGQRRSRS